MNSFVFYESFYLAVSKLPKELQAEAMEAIVKFGVFGEEYSGDEFAIDVLMEMVKANIEAAQKKRDDGRRGGRPTKTKAENHSLNNENHTFTSKKGGLSVVSQAEETPEAREEPIETENDDLNNENHTLANKKDGLNGENHSFTSEKGGLSVVSPKEEQAERGRVVCEIMLNQGVHEVRERDVGEWQEIYPAVDVPQELRKMVGWAKSNPSMRKTKKGINRFINNWLAREQDKSRTVGKQRAPVVDYGSNNLYAGGDSI